VSIGCGTTFSSLQAQNADLELIAGIRNSFLLEIKEFIPFWTIFIKKKEKSLVLKYFPYLYYSATNLLKGSMMGKWYTFYHIRLSFFSLCAIV